jgi:Predicted sugar nucleotidyltransferases
MTIDKPKCLVQLGQRTILDHQIDALRAVGICDITVIGGYRYDRLAAHVMAMSPDQRPHLIENPFWATTNSIGSVWLARPWLSGPFCLLNGDTIFEPSLMAEALSSARPGINLVIEQGPVEADDMRVAFTHNRVVTVSKLLSPVIGTARSLGIILSPDSGGRAYLDALEAVMREPHGEHSFHHDVVNRLAQHLVVHPLIVKDHAWQEIDQPSDLAAWEARLLRDAA